MIVPDTNLLLYAYRKEVVFHVAAKDWWENLESGHERVGIPWVIVTGFVRIITNPRSATIPISHITAIDIVNSWFKHGHTTTINPGRRHLDLFRSNLQAVGVGGNLVTDAHIAALAMEYQAEIHSNDSDFSRVPGIIRKNPL